MNLKKIYLRIGLGIMLCLSIIICPKSAYAYENYYDELQQNIKESLSTYDSDCFSSANDENGRAVIDIKVDIVASEEDSNHSPILCSAARTFIINLNGHTIDVNNTSPKDNGCVFSVDKGTELIINGPGTIKGGNNTGNGGAIFSKGNLELNDVTIEGCKAKNGAGIYYAGHVNYVYSIGTETYYYTYSNFTLTNVKIENCVASNNGGAIYFVDESISEYDKEGYSRAFINGSNNSISNCEAQNGSAIYVEDHCMFKIGDIDIKENTAQEKGTIYCNGDLYLDGSRITDNTAQNGGGVYLKGDAILGGNTNIINNKDNNGKDNNLCLTDEGTISFGDGTNHASPSGLMKIGLTLENMQQSSCNVSSNGSFDYANYLVPDDSNCDIEFNGTNFVLKTNYIPQKSSVKKYKTDYDKSMILKITGSGKKGSERTIYPLENKKVERVNVYDKNEEAVDVTKNSDGTYSFIQPKSDVSVDIEYGTREIKLNLNSSIALVDDETFELDVKPLIVNDRTMLPVRFISESLYANVEWDDRNPNKVIITKNILKVEITIGSNIAVVNGHEIPLDSEAFVENNRTYLPIRFIAEALNCEVIWTEENPNDVIIREK